MFPYANISWIFLLKLACYSCGVTILETGCSTFSPCIAFPMRIAANCSWHYVYCIITFLCIFVTSYVLFYCVFLLLSYILYLPDWWLEVTLRKVLWPATSTQVFLGFPVSISKCWDGAQHSKLPLHASHVALPT